MYIEELKTKTLHLSTSILLAICIYITTNKIMVLYIMIIN